MNLMTESLKHWIEEKENLLGDFRDKWDNRLSRIETEEDLENLIRLQKDYECSLREVAGGYAVFKGIAPRIKETDGYDDVYGFLRCLHDSYVDLYIITLKDIARIREEHKWI